MNIGGMKLLDHDLLFMYDLHPECTLHLILKLSGS